VHAVDAAGVHPLLLAQGTERYRPYAIEDRPEELLTQANAILGNGQMSLAKYLLIVDAADDPALDIQDIPAFFAHLLARFDPRRDLHFQTQTTIDTLDYSGSGLHHGSKLVIAARGRPRRELLTSLPPGFSLPDGLHDPALCLPGVLAVRGPAHTPDASGSDAWLEQLCASVSSDHPLNRFPWVIVCDDAEFCARTLNNFLWTTFTRSNPAADVYGVGAFVRQKHWGATGALLIDARSKRGHAPPLVEDPTVSARIDALAARGGPLHGLF
jgi:4-hydroxy-3-polyprenylbenzoate decarboxylase